MISSISEAFMSSLSRRGRSSQAVAALQRQLAAVLALVDDPQIEGVWVDVVGKDEPIFVCATEARRQAGLPPVAGRRSIGDYE
jgi:hypothetical protein